MKTTGARFSDGLAYPPRGMDDDHAAAYLGIGVTKFRELVTAGKLPPPVDLDGCPRWDRFELDRSFDNLKERRRDPDEEGRRQAEAVHRARLARRAAEDRG